MVVKAYAVSLCVLVLCCLIAATITASGQEATVYERSAEMTKRADSLRNEWRVLWKRSDSMRISSMLLRMRGDSLKVKAAAFIAAHKRDSTKTVDSVRRDSLRSIDTIPIDSAKVVGSLEHDSLAFADSLRSVLLRRLYDYAMSNLKRTKNSSTITASDSITVAMMITEPDSGVASFYANAFHGKKTSSGEVYNMNEKTCAHRWLPFGTMVRVRNLSNGKETKVRVNDRGPFKHGRVIDLSKGAAQEIDMIRAGTARVEIQVLEEP